MGVAAGDRVAGARYRRHVAVHAAGTGVAQVVVHALAAAEPFALHLGTQLLRMPTIPGLPSDHVTVFWSPALSALFTELLRRLGLSTARRRSGRRLEPRVSSALPSPTSGRAAGRRDRRSDRSCRASGNKLRCVLPLLAVTTAG